MAYEQRDVPHLKKLDPFKLEYIGERTWIIYYDATADKMIVLTGSSTDYDIENVPFAFRIEYIMICADDATAKDIDIYPIPLVASQLAYPARIHSASGDILTDQIIELGREYKFPKGTTIRFKLNGTLNKKIFVLVNLQRLGP